jgi:nitroreductase
MPHLSRRNMVLAGASFIASSTHAPMILASEVRKMERRADKTNPLTEIMARRQSTRSFEDKQVEPEKLAQLLWVANGINRSTSGGRTAPSWHGSYGTDLLVADGVGVWRYEPQTETLQQAKPDDIRKIISPQPFVATAPIVILHAVDLARMYKAHEEEQIRFAYVDAAIVAQNIYVYCASAGLGTCLVGGVDAKALAAALSLEDKAFIAYAQPIGYAKPS